MIPYGRQSIIEADIEAVANVLRGDWLTTGPFVAQFERDIAVVAGVPDPAVCVTSGTAALHVAYAGLGPGDEVVTTPLTFAATATCAAMHGAKVVFADICADNGNLDPAAAAAATSAKTRFVAGVDFAGHPIDAAALSTVAHDVGALLLEDAAHSIGGFAGGAPVGSLADVTTFSFFPTKNLTTAEGGAIVATDQAYLERVRRFKGIGMVREPEQLRSPEEGHWWYEIPELGLNYRLPDVLAALGSSQLTRLPSFKERRAHIFARYQEAFADLDGVLLPSQREDVSPVWHFYPLRVLDGRRRAVFDRLRRHGIGVQVNYIPVYWHPYFEDLGYRRGQCPVAETYYEQEISLPVFADLDDNRLDQVIDTVIAAVRGT